MIVGPRLRSVANRKLITELSWVIPHSRRCVQIQDGVATDKGGNKVSVLKVGELVKLATTAPVTFKDHLVIYRPHPTIAAANLGAAHQLLVSDDEPQPLELVLAPTKKIDLKKLPYLFELYIMD